MNTLDRYVLREWLKVCLLAALGFPFLVMVIDLVDKLGTYLGRGIPKGRIALSYIYFLPETISLVLPVAVLFAVVFTVGALGRHSELTAAKASGVSFHRVVRPLLVASLAAVVLDLGLTELAPVTSARRAELLGDKQVRLTAIRYNFVYRADGGWVYAISSLEIGPRLMRDVIMEREGTGQPPPAQVTAATGGGQGRGAEGRGGGGGGGLDPEPGGGALPRRPRPGADVHVRYPAHHGAPGDADGPARRAQGAGRDALRRAGSLHRRLGALGLGHEEAAGGARPQVGGPLRLHHHRGVRRAARDLHAAERHGVGRGGMPRDAVHRSAGVPAVQGCRLGRRPPPDVRGVGAEPGGRRRGSVAAGEGEDVRQDGEGRVLPRLPPSVSRTCTSRRAARASATSWCPLSGAAASSAHKCHAGWRHRSPSG